MADMLISTSRPIQTNRDTLIDILKGYAIFLVVWGHSIQFFGEGLEMMNQTLGKYIYIFHMPLFFFMSSLVGTRAITLSFGDMMKNKFRTLIVPLLVFSLLQYIICIIFDYVGGEVLTGRYLVRELCYKIVGSYWFIIILMFYFIVLNISYKIANQNMKLTVTIVLILWLISFAIPRPNIPFGLYITYFQSFMPFFILGYFMKVYDIYGLIKNKSKYIVLPFNLLLCYIIYKTIKSDFVYFQNYNLWGSNERIFEIIIDIIISESWLILGGLIGIVSLISLFHLLHDNIVFNCLNTIGKHTLGIYLIQGVIFNSLLAYNYPQVNNDLGYFFIAIGITTVSYLIIQLIRNTAFGQISLGLKK